jgi:L-aminopeptidase/D-esterase-like protein
VRGTAPLSAAEGSHTRDVGSIIVVIATDAPLTPHQLKRLARRVPLGLGRTGAIEMNGSGDIFLAFSTANIGADNGNSNERADNPHTTKDVALRRLASRDMDPLFAAVTQATEEAVDNALIAAKTMVGPNYWVVPALPQDQLKAILRKHRILKQQAPLAGGIDSHPRGSGAHSANPSAPVPVGNLANSNRRPSTQKEAISF